MTTDQTDIAITTDQRLDSGERGLVLYLTAVTAYNAAFAVGYAVASDGLFAALHTAAATVALLLFVLTLVDR